MINNCFPNFPQGVNCGIKPWRWQCLQILPTIFDESLSYYENICKLQAVIAQIIQEGMQTDQDVTQLQKEMQEVQAFIDNWNENAEAIIKELIGNISTSFIVPFIDNDGYFKIEYTNFTDLSFFTTGYDITIPGYNFGHLMLKEGE